MGGRTVELESGGRLDQRNKARSLGQKWARFWDAFPERVRHHGPSVLGWSAVIGVFIWEARNATLGFQQMWRPGMLLAMVGGVGTSFAAIFLCRVMMEEWRAFAGAGVDMAKRSVHFMNAIIRGTLMVGAMLVTLFGVWSNLAADNIRRGTHQIENSGERSAIIANIRSYESDLRVYSETLDIEVEANKDELRRVENVGRQWDLPKLDSNPGGDCDADLKAYARKLCNDAARLRLEITKGQGIIVRRDEIVGKLNAERAKLVDTVDSEGVEHLQEMASLMGDETQWKFWGSIATLLCSAILLLIAAFLSDVMLERRQPAKGA